MKPTSSGTDTRLWLGVAAAAVLAAPILALADVGPPAHMQITERRAGTYDVQWRVPKALPARAAPTPILPEGCSPSGDPAVIDQPAAWLVSQEWSCDASLAGQSIGMRYRFPDLALTTVIRVDLLSGDRFAHVLSPGDGPWRLPEGTAAPDLIGGASRAVVAGVFHVLGSWVHAAFLLTLALFGGLLWPIRLVTAFTGGQVLAVLIGAIVGLQLGAVPAELCFALATALLAREALRPADERRRLWSLAAIAGAMHGLGIGPQIADRVGEAAAGPATQILAIVGMDATHLVAAITLAGALGWLAARAKRPATRTALVYGTGVAAMALAVGLAVGGSAEDAGAAGPQVTVPEGPAAGGAAPGSRRLAAAAPDAPAQSFLSVEPFEIRHEVMFRLEGLAAELDLEPESSLAVESQGEITRRLVELVLSGTRLTAGGLGLKPLVRRADFMTVAPTGALPRATPVPEPVAEAVVGIVIAYPTSGMPEEVALTWDPTPVAMIPATVIDPENVASSMLSADQTSLTWRNELSEDPVPTVAAVEIEPLSVPLPILSLPLLALVAALLVLGLRRRRELALVAGRVTLALAFVVGPIVQTAVALPGSAGRTPSERQARRILSGLLPNIYRALEFRDEALIFDRLAVSVTGETLTDVYLEQRRALEVEERGGAQARVETVEVLEAGNIASLDDGFEVRSIWTVGGMVTHFGHRHFRQNRYDARVGIVPVDGAWKISSIEVLEQERLR